MRLIVAIGFVVLLASPGTAAAQDPAIVNANTISVKLENDSVRVMEATLVPGTKERLHSHPAYVIYVIVGGKVRMHTADGRSQEAEFKSGDVMYSAATTHWGENIGTTTIKLMLVELRRSKASGQ